MLITSSKKILGQRLQGVRPVPEDDVLTELALEAMLYIAGRTVPSVLVRDIDSDGQEYRVFRVIEDNKYIIFPDTPVYDLQSPDYSAIAHLNIDEDLSYAVVYYIAWLVLQGNEATQRGGVRKGFMDQVDEYINLYESNFTRAGRETYDLM